MPALMVILFQFQPEITRISPDNQTQIQLLQIHALFDFNLNKFLNKPENGRYF